VECIGGSVQFGNANPELSALQEKLEQQLLDEQSPDHPGTAQAELEQFHRLVDELVSFRHEYENNDDQINLREHRQRLQHEAQKIQRKQHRYVPRGFQITCWQPCCMLR